MHFPCLALAAGIRTKRNRVMLYAVLTYPVVWLFTQFAWVYGGFKPDYDVLQLDDLFSLFLTIGVFSFFTGIFFLNGKLCSIRDYRLGDMGLSYYINGGGDTTTLEGAKGERTKQTHKRVECSARHEQN